MTTVLVLLAVAAAAGAGWHARGLCDGAHLDRAHERADQATVRADIAWRALETYAPHELERLHAQLNDQKDPK